MIAAVGAWQASIALAVTKFVEGSLDWTRVQAAAFRVSTHASDIFALFVGVVVEASRVDDLSLHQPITRDSHSRRASLERDVSTVEGRIQKELDFATHLVLHTELLDSLKSQGLLVQNGAQANYMLAKFLGAGQNRGVSQGDSLSLRWRCVGCISPSTLLSLVLTG